jgi:hypothetical protein
MDQYVLVFFGPGTNDLLSVALSVAGPYDSEDEAWDVADSNPTISWNYVSVVRLEKLKPVKKD